VASPSDPHSLRAKASPAAASRFSADFQAAALERAAADATRRLPPNQACDPSAESPLDAARPHAPNEVSPELKRFLYARKYGGHCRGLAAMGLSTPPQLLEFCQSSDAAAALKHRRTGLGLSTFEASAFIKAVASSNDPDSLRSLSKFQVRPHRKWSRGLTRQPLYFKELWRFVPHCPHWLDGLMCVFFSKSGESGRCDDAGAS
jgi:hypothetical protein